MSKSLEAVYTKVKKMKKTLDKRGQACYNKQADPRERREAKEKSQKTFLKKIQKRG